MGELVEEPLNEVEARLGLSWINTAKRGYRAHQGKMVGERLALLLFGKQTTGETIVSLWDIEDGRAITSETLQFPVTMLWNWDWRAEQVEQAFARLAPAMDSDPHVAASRIPAP
jgi:hypothetical protein